eukprot:scaffold27600_cov51-Phaeocystis_antarctica.AAC.1
MWARARVLCRTLLSSSRRASWPTTQTAQGKGCPRGWVPQSCSRCLEACAGTCLCSRHLPWSVPVRRGHGVTLTVGRMPVNCRADASNWAVWGTGCEIVIRDYHIVD